jgi:putative mRNA 3-end processing factor
MKDLLKKLEVTPLRICSGRGIKPHLSICFNEGRRIFAVDTTVFPKTKQPDCYLITHAHSDHHGKSAMKSPLSIASTETATALELLHGQKFNGATFNLGEEICPGDTQISTHPTSHTIGSAAYYWETENGVRILVTGDVKDYTALPRCDLLITEANYGNPKDSTCYFEDDIEGFQKAMEGEVVFGAYVFGKAQRAVTLLRRHGFNDAIAMTQRCLKLTQALLRDAGELVEISEGAEVCIAAPHELSTLNPQRCYVLTAREDYPYPTIHISDHMDVRGLIAMVKHCKPEAAIIYHPRGERPRRLAEYLNEHHLCRAIAAENIPPVRLK